MCWSTLANSERHGWVSIKLIHPFNATFDSNTPPSATPPHCSATAAPQRPAIRTNNCSCDVTTQDNPPPPRCSALMRPRRPRRPKRALRNGFPPRIGTRARGAWQRCCRRRRLLSRSTQRGDRRAAIAGGGGTRRGRPSPTPRGFEKELAPSRQSAPSALLAITPAQRRSRGGVTNEVPRCPVRLVVRGATRARAAKGARGIYSATTTTTLPRAVVARDDCRWQRLLGAWRLLVGALGPVPVVAVPASRDDASRMNLVASQRKSNGRVSF